MSKNNAKNIKVILGVIAMTSLTALTSPANAKTLDSDASVQNLMNQAKLNLDTTKQQADKSFETASLEKLELSTKIALKSDNNSCSNGTCRKN